MRDAEPVHIREKNEAVTAQPRAAAALGGMFQEEGRGGGGAEDSPNAF